VATKFGFAPRDLMRMRWPDIEFWLDRAEELATYEADEED